MRLSEGPLTVAADSIAFALSNGRRGGGLMYGAAVAVLGSVPLGGYATPGFGTERGLKQKIPAGVWRQWAATPG